MILADPESNYTELHYLWVTLKHDHVVYGIFSALGTFLTILMPQ
jgi:hypothetical protein